MHQLPNTATVEFSARFDELDHTISNAMHMGHSIQPELNTAADVAPTVDIVSGPE